MAKRKRGQVPYDNEHPDRFWMPDVPNHRQKAGHGGARAVVKQEQKEQLEKQVARLREQIVTPSGENKG